MDSHTAGSDADRAAPDAASTIKLVVAWAWVGIPAAWGVWQVFKKSLDLFQ